MLPRYLQDGNLYIGLSGSDPEGALSLYFHLRPESAAECLQRARPQASWAVWCEEGWRTLEAGRLLSDSTLGFLRSGIVVLDLPAGMSRACPRMPGDLYWIRLSADGGLESGRKNESSAPNVPGRYLYFIGQSGGLAGNESALRF